jgi:integrase
MSKDPRIPSYRRHKQSGQAIVTLTDGQGERRDVLLGKYRSMESRQEYARVISEWEAAGYSLAAQDPKKDLTVTELLSLFWDFAEKHYRRPDGSPGKELDEYKFSLRSIKHFYGHTFAKEFGPLALKNIRKKLIDGWEDPKHGPQKDLARGVINQRIGRIRRVFRWAVEQELVPAAVLHALQAVGGLQRGRSEARETEPVRPVPETFVEAALPYARPAVAAMARLQLLTGMRPGEVVIMRGIDLETGGKVWFYRPGSDRGPHGEHKTAWRGQGRVIAIGPRAQEILRPFLKTDLTAYLFSPADTMEAVWAEKRSKKPAKKRGGKRPAHKRKRHPQRWPGDHYAVSSYGRAITAACRLADRAAHENDPGIPAEQIIVPSWHPHQLRHTKATEIRREAGLDAARVVLGHRSPQVTETYAEIDTKKAAEIMAQLG